MSAIEECLERVRLTLPGTVSKAECELTQLRARIADLEKQWEEHCAFHGSESPHALQAALYRASDAESHCKALAEDRSALTAQVEALTAERDQLQARDVCWHCLVCLVADSNHCEKCPPPGECDDETCKAEGHTEPILIIHSGGPIGGGPKP